MSVPIHTVNIFQRPREGSSFQRRVIALNYQHTISAQGWFDTMRCDIAVRSQGEGQEYLDRFLGCRVFAYADNPYEPMWEGFINRITFNTGGVSYTISLDELANRVTVVYNSTGDAATVTGTANSTVSQGIYGIKQDQMEYGANASATTSGPNSLRDTILAQRAFPQTSITKGGGATNLVTLECCGFYETFKWEKLFSGASAATVSFDTGITTILAALANASTFVSVSDTSQIAANAKLVSAQRRAMSAWDWFLRIAESGDATNYWITGVMPTNPQTGIRRVYYRQVSSGTQYTAKQSDGLRVRDLYGRIVPPWYVKPDNTIMVSDVLVGFNTASQVDPRLTYIFRINYDANSQSVQWFGADDTSASAAWLIRRGYKPVSRAFGANWRVQVG